MLRKIWASLLGKPASMIQVDLENRVRELDAIRIATDSNVQTLLESLERANSTITSMAKDINDIREAKVTLENDCVRLKKSEETAHSWRRRAWSHEQAHLDHILRLEHQTFRLELDCFRLADEVKRLSPKTKEAK